MDYAHYDRRLARKAIKRRLRRMGITDKAHLVDIGPVLDHPYLQHDDIDEPCMLKYEEFESAIQQ